VNLYVDSSALMRRYLSRPGGAEFDQEFEGADRLGTAALTQIEVACALMRLVKGRAIRRSAAARGLGQLDDDLAYVDEVSVNESLVRLAREVGSRHQLKGYDAVQLAAAMIWRASVSEAVVVATFDAELWVAAQAEGFNVWLSDLARFG
jgi:uncharacterized protein